MTTPAESLAVTQPHGFLTTEDGRLLLLDGNVPVVQAVDTAGTVRTIGGIGGGPGEYRIPTRFGWLGETLWVYDGSSQHFLRYDVAGRPLDPLAAPTTVVHADGSADSPPVRILARAPLDGVGDSLLATFSPRGSPPEWLADVDSGSTVFAVVDRAGRVIRRVTVHAPERCIVLHRFDGGTASVVIPHCRERMRSEWSDGPVLAMVDIERDGYRVRAVERSGLVRFDLRRPTTPIPLTAEQRAEAETRVDRQLERIPPGAVASGPLDVPDHLAPVRRVFATATGEVWLEEEDGVEGHDWLRFSRDGELSGRLHLPAGTALVAVRNHLAWATVEREDTLLDLVAYRIREAE